jgi:hypothetical protein
LSLRRHELPRALQQFRRIQPKFADHLLQILP